MRSRVSRSPTLFFALLTCAVVGSCTHHPNEITDQGSFTVALSPLECSIQAGSNYSALITVSRSGAFTDAVSLSVEGVPTGISAAFTPGVVGTGSTSATLAFTVASTVAPGVYSVTIIGSSGDMTDQRATMSVTILAAQSGGFSIALNQAALSVEQGQNGTANVTISRTAPFTGAVTLTLDGAPTGVTAGFAPGPVPAGATQSVLTIGVGASVAPGAYTFEVRAVGSGVGDQWTPLYLTVTAAPVGSFELMLDPTALSVHQGQDGATTVTIARTAPFAGAVNVVLDSAPTGVTASFAPGAIPSGGNTSIATISVASSVPVGVYALFVHGTAAGGVPDRSVPLSLTVTAAPVGSFTLSLTQTALSVQQGQSGTTTVTVARTAPFAGAVNLSLDGAPSGVTAGFNPGPIPAGGTTSTATISVAASVGPGVYALNVHGTAGGVADHLAPLNLTVTAAPPPTQVDLLFCQLDAAPVWLGYQDGNGPWQQVVGAGGTYSFNLTADRGAIAYVQRVTEQGVTSYDVSLVYATRAEFIEAAPLACAASQPLKTLTGTVPSRSALDFFAVAIGDGYAEIPTGTPGTNFTLEGATTGVRDLVAGRLRSNLPLLPADLIIRRGTNYPAGSTIPALDFGSAEAFAAEMKNVTVVGLGSDPWDLSDDYITGNRTFGYLPTMTPTSPTTTFATVPSPQAWAGDVYNLRATAFSLGGAATRQVTNAFATPTDQTLTLGGMLFEPSVFTLSAAPFYQVRITTTLQADYSDVFSGKYVQPDRTGVVYVTRGWLGGNAVSITTPDLTGVPGWLATYGPRPGINTTLIAKAFGLTGSSGSLVPLWGQAFTGGVVIRAASLSKQTVP